MIPTVEAFEVPLLKALDELGGQAKAKDVYPLVRSSIPEITDFDLLETVPSGEPKWMNRTRWARLHLVKKGEMDSPAHGVWAITSKGKKRLASLDPKVTSTGAGGAAVAKHTKPEGDGTPDPISLVEIYETYEADFRQQLLDRLQELDPYQFEVFAEKMLKTYGFVDVTVTAKCGDGGLDGHGRLKVGLATMSVAFQCKRWSGNIPRPEIDKFRGAISGEYEQGIFFTTADFTKGATEASIRKGAVPIVLINGPMIIDLMVSRGFGVVKRPLELYYERLDSVFNET